MKGILKLFGERELIKGAIQDFLGDIGYEIESECLDNKVVFEEIESDAFFDLCDALEDYIYNDFDTTLEETLVAFLHDNHLKIATAESCTGGLVSAGIVNVSGASEVFYEGIVSYCNLSKQNRLGVSADLIWEFGAVSAEVAKEMAYGLMDDMVDIAVSTTGIAGPNGGTEVKPVGLVYIGIAHKDNEPIALKNIFAGDRAQIRASAKNAALFYTLQYLKEHY